VSMTAPLAGALERVRPKLAGNERGLQGLDRELARWGHERHELTLKRVDR